MKWFAIIVFATSYAGDRVMVEVDDKVECVALIVATAETAVTGYIKKSILQNSKCIYIHTEK